MSLRALEILLSLLPALLFLGGLQYMDSFKLLRLPSILATLAMGCLAAAAAAAANTALILMAGVERTVEIRYVAPVVEETLKAAYLILLLRAQKVGFMVDAAIRGFAVGTGFALVENLYYLLSRPEAGIALAIIRGFGTALMHGAATAIVGIIAKTLADRGQSFALALLPGWALAVALHSAFNHFFLSPSLSTVAILIALPLAMVAVFTRSERATRDWLGEGFDVDRELLEMITTGTLADNRIGQYLHSLQSTFPGPAVADMLCLLRLRVELSLRAKGVLLMRDAGFRVAVDPEVQEQFAELRYLERSIGKTGILALHPFLQSRKKQLWELQMLGA